MKLDRRSFLASALAAAAGGLVGCASAPSGPKTRVALQLYSVRGLMQTPTGFAQTLKAVRDMGYAGVEFAGYGGFAPAELKRMLDDLGLARVGTHIGLDALRPDAIRQTLDFNLGYGNSFLTISWMNPPANCRDRHGFWLKFADDLSVAAETAKASGCRIAYHNHQHEFREKLKGAVPYQIVFDHASPLVCAQPDVGHMVSAGVDPVFWFGKYAARTPSIHAKEVYGKGGATGVLGQPGTAKGVDWPALYAATDAAHIDWYVVECESNPNTLEHVKGSFDFLHAAGRC